MVQVGGEWRRLWKKAALSFGALSGLGLFLSWAYLFLLFRSAGLQSENFLMLPDLGSALVKTLLNGVVAILAFALSWIVWGVIVWRKVGDHRYKVINYIARSPGNAARLWSLFRESFRREYYANKRLMLFFTLGQVAALFLILGLMFRENIGNHDPAPSAWQFLTGLLLLSFAGSVIFVSRIKSPLKDFVYVVMLVLFIAVVLKASIDGGVRYSISDASSYELTLSSSCPTNAVTDGGTTNCREYVRIIKPFTAGILVVKSDQSRAFYTWSGIVSMRRFDNLKP